MTNINKNRNFPAVESKYRIYGDDDFLLDMNLALHWSLPFASRNFID